MGRLYDELHSTPSPRMAFIFSVSFSKPKQTTHQHTNSNNANTTELCATTQRQTQASHKCVFHTSGKTKTTMCDMCYVIRITPIAYCTIFRPIVYCLLPTAFCPLHITKDPSAYSPRLTPPNSPKPSSSLPQQHMGVAPQNKSIEANYTIWPATAKQFGVAKCEWRSRGWI